MPRKATPTKPEAEMTALEKAQANLEKVYKRFTTKPAPDVQKELIEATDVYRGAFISELS